jgi:hypothetical protein
VSWTLAVPAVHLAPWDLLHPERALVVCRHSTIHDDVLSPATPFQVRLRHLGWRPLASTRPRSCEYAQERCDELVRSRGHF